MFRPAVESIVSRFSSRPLSTIGTVLAVSVAGIAVVGTPFGSGAAVSPQPAGTTILSVDFRAGAELVTQTQPVDRVVDYQQPSFAVEAVTVDLGGPQRFVPLGDTSVIDSDDADIMFDEPLTENDLVLVQDRSGDDSIELLALDSEGQTIEGAGAITVGEPFAWNTGYAQADLFPPQPSHLAVVDVKALVPDHEATESSVRVHGLRVAADGSALIGIQAMTTDSAAPTPEKKVGTPSIGHENAPAGTAANTPVVDDSEGAESLDDAESSDDAVGSDDAVDGFAPEGPSLPLAGEALAFAKTVYLGVDGGAGCDGALGFAEGGQDDPVTYCFTVTNTGTTSLGSIAITDPFVNGEPVLISADSDPLEPGHSVRYYVEAVPPPDDADGFQDDTYINVASVTAMPVDLAGAPISGAPPLIANAEAVVFPAEEAISLAPALQLATTVYPGSDAGGGCPSVDSASVNEGESVTFCYSVTNTGNTHLASVSFADLGINGEPTMLSADSEPLAPGDSALFYLEGTVPAMPVEGLITTSVVTANSVDESGADLVGLEDVVSSDQAMIEAAAPAQLAFTGWETWLVATAGAGLMAGGLLLLQSANSQTTPAATGNRRPIG